MEDIQDNMNIHSQTHGYLDITLGPMFSEKTTHLVAVYDKFTKGGIPVKIINHSFDNRYSTDECISTHNLLQRPCIQCTNIREVWNYDDMNELVKQPLYASKVILIDEGQFYTDIVCGVSDMLKHGKHVYICGLDGDFNRQVFGDLLRLIPLCDKVRKLNSICGICKTQPAIFSHRITSNQEQIGVGGEAQYVPACRNCFDKKNNK